MVTETGIVMVLWKVRSAEYCTRSGKCGVQSIVQEVENADDVIVI